jgi:ankyrin repeat protein
MHVKCLCAWWMVALLSVVSLAATSSDVRLAEAVKNGDKEVVRALLKQHVDLDARQGDGTTALAWAAHRDDLDMAELLIRAGANVNAANDFGITPLSLACTNGSAAMVEKLLQAGANPNAALSTGETALMTAAHTGDVEAVKSLLTHGAGINAKESKRGQTALMWAVAENHAEVARSLIEHGADVHARSKRGFTPLLFAAQQGNLDSARILLAAGANVNEAAKNDGAALVVASASGHEEFSIFLLDNGADPNAADGYGITALHYTVLRGLSILGGVRFRPDTSESVLSYLFRPNMRGLAKALLEHGANPNARIVKAPPFPHSRPLVMSPVGATPFLLAAASYDADLMRILAASGADPLLATEEKTTPLIMAAGLGEGLGKLAARTEEEDRSALEAVKLAVHLGADVNEANDTGLTAMHSAAYVGADAIIQFLVDKGAKVDVKDKFGQTPLSVAERIIPASLVDGYLKPTSVHKSTADLLRKLGAKPMTAHAAQLSDVSSKPANE